MMNHHLIFVPDSAPHERWFIVCICVFCTYVSVCQLSITCTVGQVAFVLTNSYYNKQKENVLIVPF